MKYFYILLLQCCCAFACAQADTTVLSEILDANNIRAVINSNGILFKDFQTGKGGFTHKDFPDIPLFRSAGLWVSSVDEGGNLKVGVQTDHSGGFVSGIGKGYDYPGESIFNHVSKVTIEDIERHRRDCLSFVFHFYPGTRQ